MISPVTDPSLDAFAHGFFGRAGGVSTGLYASLNCGVGSKDRLEHVVENRDRVGRCLGADGTRVLTCHQVHSADVVVVDRPWPRGERPKADALVTRTRGLVLGALAADCMPILFADPVAGVVGAAHAGWRGALAGVEASTIRAMESLGARRADIRAVIGPCISGANYEVGPDFRATFIAADPGHARFFHEPKPGARPHFDLPAFMLSRLGILGLAHVGTRSACTYQDPGAWFSFRRATHQGEPDYGRQISAIAIS